MNTIVKYFLILPFSISVALAQNGIWDTTKTDMPTKKWSHTAEIVEGKIYTIGGFDVNDNGLNKIELYDPANDLWDTTKTPMPTARGYAASGVIAGKIYIFGGAESGDAALLGELLNITESYDPQTDSWDTTLTAMPTLRIEAQAVVINDSIYVIGGLDDELQGLDIVEVYDPETDSWDTTRAPMLTARSRMSPCVVDGKIYTFGGLPALYYTHSVAVEMYDPVTNTWTSKSDLPQPRSHAASCVYNGFIYLFGGIQRESYGGLNFTLRPAVLMYDPKMDLWLKVSVMPTSRQLPTANKIDGKIYTIGGIKGEYPWIIVNTVELYTPVQHPIYAYNHEIGSIYLEEETDSLLIQTEFINHQNHEFTAHAIYKTLDLSFRDSIILYNDGQHGDELADDSIYGNYLKNIDSENHFLLDFKTHNLSTDEDFIITDAEYFTTIGSLSLSEYVAGTISKFSLPLKLSLQNNGSVATAHAVQAHLSPRDTNIVQISSNDQTFGDIPAGESRECQGTYYLVLNPNSKDDSLLTLSFNLSISSDGYVFWYDSSQVIVSIDQNAPVVPFTYSLLQNYPNPFNPSTTITFNLPKSERVKLEVYNTLGQKVATLLDRKMNAGSHDIQFDASDLPSGIYFYRIQVGDAPGRTGEFSRVRKMVLMK